MAEVGWEALSGWEAVLPPNRPDRIDLAIVDAVSAVSRRASACILGSTPEYRAVLRKHFTSVRIVDRSPSFKSVSDAIVGSDERETVVVEDWLTALHSHQSKFDIVVSHFTHGNVPFADRNDFFRGIAASLADGGVFVDTIFHPYPLVGPDEIRSRFVGRPANLQTVNDFNATAIFRSAVIQELGCIDTTVIYAWLRKVFADVPELLQLVETCETRVTPSGLIWDYSPNRPPDKLGYREHLNVLVEVPCDSSSALAPCVVTRISSRRIT